MSIAELLEAQKKQHTKIHGVVTGVVTNNQDPDGLGRVKVKIPRLSGDDETWWARIATLMAGPERGSYFLPEVEDEVLLVFEYGDINMPYVIGALWNGVDKPPADNSDGQNNIRIIKSRSGHVIRLNDQDGSEKIEIIDSNNNSLVFDTANNAITITSEQDITLSAPQGTIKIDAQNIEITSSADTKIESSAGMDVEASGTMNVKGATVNIN